MNNQNSNTSTPTADALPGVKHRNTDATCRTCKGNDGDMPCAYPSQNMPDCLRDARLRAQSAAVPK